MLVVSLTEIVNRDHVWMTQHRRGTRLSAKTRERGIVLDELSGQDLYRHIVSDMNATRTIDHAHTALAQSRHQFILAVDHVTDEWIGIDQANRGKGRVVMIFVVRMRALSPARVSGEPQSEQNIASLLRNNSHAAQKGL